jgi:uncharacterized membrane protein YdjX (TVP38/TMEM64 family)
MRRLLSLALFCFIIVVMIFLIFGEGEDMVIQNLVQQGQRWRYISLSFFMLAGDVILPVPSSLVMIANGKILGMAGGALLSFLAGMVSSCIGFLLGRFAGSRVSGFFSEPEKRAGDLLFERFGAFAVIVSKCLPILSEVLSFVSGTTSMSMNRFLRYSIIGHAIISLMYAAVGAYAQEMGNSQLISAGIIAGVLIIGWLVQRFIKAAA